MKKIFTLMALMLAINAIAQSPEKMSYQAVIRDVNNQVVTNQQIGMQISILAGSADGAAMYIEIQSPTSNANGLISMEIGSGTVIFGDFSLIDWSNGSYFLMTEADPQGGNNYTITGVTQLLSVPFAMYAKSAGNAFSGSYNDLTDVPQNFDGDFSNLSNVPTGLSDGDDDTQLTESEVDAFVANNGYLTAEVDGSVTNEIELPTQDGQAGKVLTTDGTGPSWTTLTDTNTQLSESEVDVFVSNNGYLTVEVDGSVTNEIQDLQLSGNDLSITNNGSATTIDLSSYLDNTDTQLSESEVDAFVANNGYLTAEVDGDVTNEIQDLQLSENNLIITNNGSATTIDLSSYLDNTDTQLSESEVDAFVANNGYLTAEVDGSVTNEIELPDQTGNIGMALFTDGADPVWKPISVFDIFDLPPLVDLVYLDDFVFSNITGVPAELLDGDNDTQLTEAEVDDFVSNNGYLTAEVDGDATNEIQDLQLSGNDLSITNNGTATTIDLSSYLDNTDTQLNESEVDAFVANNGYLTAETDGSTTNEIQDLQLSGNNLSITNNGSATTIDLSAYLDNTDTQLTEAEVDDFVSDNGFLTTELDGDPTNELELPSQTGHSGKVLTTDGSSVSWTTASGFDGVFSSLSGIPTGLSDGDDDTQLSETQVDAFVANNGYLTSFTEVDGDPTNELELPSQTGHSGKVLTTDGSSVSWTSAGGFDGAFSSLSGIPTGLSDGDDDTQLNETQVDAFVANNGYLTSFTEVDGDPTNELELPAQSGQGGKYLTTDGSSVSWSTVAAGSSMSVVTISANTTLTATDQIVFINGAFTATLPASPVDGQRVTLCSTNQSAGVNGNGRLIYLSATSLSSLTFADASVNVYNMFYSSTLNAWFSNL